MRTCPNRPGNQNVMDWAELGCGEKMRCREHRTAAGIECQSGFTLVFLPILGESRPSSANDDSRAPRCFDRSAAGPADGVIFSPETRSPAESGTDSVPLPGRGARNRNLSKCRGLPPLKTIECMIVMRVREAAKTSPFPQPKRFTEWARGAGGRWQIAFNSTWTKSRNCASTV